MITITLTIGIPASSKSTWAKEQVTLDPEGTVRINRDDLRSSLSNYHYSKSNEKLVSDIRESVIVHALKSGRNVILDDTNLVPKNFTDICKLVQKLNIDVTVTEKSFYVELDEAIRRDSLRTGSSHVGADVIRKFWKKSGGELHQHYKIRAEVFYKRTTVGELDFIPMIQDKSAQKAVIIDNDGTICTMTNILTGIRRNPYNPTTCDYDTPHEHVIEAMKLYYNNGHKILFVSGREEKYRAPTERFYKKHFPEVEYELFMRPTGDMRKDVIIKEEIFNNHIKNKYYITAWFDDRLQVCEWVFRNGLPLFRVNDPSSSF